jgi:hypothetical protein
VTNTGKQTLSNVSVTDIQMAPAGELTSGPTCPKQTLTPGAAMNCTGTYKVRQADVDHGNVNDSAIAHGTPPHGPAVDSAPSDATVPVTDPASTEDLNSAGSNSLINTGLGANAAGNGTTRITAALGLGLVVLGAGLVIAIARRRRTG